MKECPEKNMGSGSNRLFLDEIKRLLTLGKPGEHHIVPDIEGLSREEIEVLEAINNYKVVIDYDFIKHKLASDALGIALWDIDKVESIPITPDGKAIWSKELRNMLGFDDEEDFPNQLGSLLLRVHPEDVEMASNAANAHLSDYTGNTPFDFECRIKMKNGEYRYFHNFGRALRDNKGVPLRLAGALMDINDEKQLEIERTQVLETVQGILNSLDASIYATIPETGELLFINEYMRKGFGIEDLDITGKYCYQIFRSGFDAMCEFCPCYQLEKDPDATIIWDEYFPETQMHVRHADCYIDWYDGRKVHLQHAVDITDIMQSQESLKSMTEELRYAMKEIENRDGIMRAVNQTAALLLAAEENENLEEPLMTGMELIGRSIKADRVHIWQIAGGNDMEAFFHTHCWCSETGRQKVHMQTGVSYPFGKKPQWEESFMRGESISGPVSKMNQGEREFFESFDVISTVMIPLFINENFWGLFTVDDCKQEREFTKDEVAMLKSVSLMMASAINNRSLSNALKDTQEIAMQRLEGLVDERTRELREAERQLTKQFEYAKRLADALALITKLPNIQAGDIKAAAETIAMEGCNVLNVNRISIWNLSDNGDALECITCYERSTGEHDVHDDFDLRSRVEYANLLNSERLIIASDINESAILDDGYNPDLCAMLEAPIRIDGNLVGLVCADLDRCEEFPEAREWLIEEQNFVSSLADLMALAISGYERRVARDAAETANQAKSSFLANMSHEIRTPMNAILGVTDILIQNESLPDDIEEGLGRIYNSCDMLLSIINDLLDFSKIEAGKMDILPTQYKVASLINDSVQLNMMRIYGKPIEFELQVDENAPAKLVGDELRIKQILSNLLSNAFKYTENGVVCLSVVSEHWPDGDGVTLVLIVKDTGRGMTQDQLSRLFSEYMRFNERASDNIEGTGLGLVISQGLIDMMNGSINVESELGVGSTFTVRLPQKTVDDEVLGKDVAKNLEQFRMNYVTRKKRGQIIRDMMPYGSVLIVDDMEPNIYVATGLLRPYGLQIETAVSGLETIDLIKKGKSYDIIFMDHMMPEMDGIETTKELRDLGYDKPIVALTANAVSGQSNLFLENGFDEFISKPVDIRQLNSVLNKHIRDKYPSHIVESVDQKVEDEEPIINDAQGEEDINRRIPGLNMTRGLEQHDGNEKYYYKVLRSYTASVKIVLDEIENVSKDALPEYKLKVHGIKGASNSIFAEQIGQKAKDLEKAAERNDFGFITKHNADFIKDTRKFIDDIDAYLSEAAADDSKPAKDKPDVELLAKLLDACKEYNMNDAEDIMEKIDEYRYESDDGLVSWLSDKVNLMSYTQIVEKLTEILNQ